MNSWPHKERKDTSQWTLCELQHWHKTFCESLICIYTHRQYHRPNLVMGYFKSVTDIACEVQKICFFNSFLVNSSEVILPLHLLISSEEIIKLVGIDLYLCISFSNNYSFHSS